VNKISGRIINHDESFDGLIEFTDKIESVNKTQITNSQNIMTRPIWTLMNKLPMFKDAQCGNLTNAEWLEERVVNIPSSVIL